MRVTVYTKPGCHLCEDTLLILDRLAPQYNLQIEEVNILDSMPLYDEYKYSIPVVKIEDGRLGTLEAPIDEASLRTVFETARRGMPPPPGGTGQVRAQAVPAGLASPVVPVVKEMWIDRLAGWIAKHWLRFACIVLAVFVGLPWLSGLLAWMGLWEIANPIYTFYSLTCHQLPERAGTVFGYQVAFCYRNTALYGGVLLFGIGYGLARDRDVPWLRWLKDPLPWWGLAMLMLPMLVDGITHMLGLRDSMLSYVEEPSYGTFLVGSQPLSLNWWLRIATGLLAALGAVWFAYPRMERTIEESEAMRLVYKQSAAHAGITN
jgi:uncharacterized membrane protein/glutaredoxin